ncbi:MAG: D-glycerate dehydrogenase [Patescibacteria group bacterium]
MTKTIFITRMIPNIAIKMLQEKGYIVDINPKDRVLSQKQLIKYLQKKPYDAVLSLLTDHINTAVFDAAPSVKIYANYATGFDNIDLIEAKKRSITITNAPTDLSSEAVAEHTIALMLAMTSRIVEADNFVRKGKFVGWAPMHFIGTRLHNKNLALVGVGKIGSRVALFAKGLGMNIMYTDVVRNERLEKDLGAIYYNSVDALLPHADVVSLHVPLLDSTKHLINESRLKEMKSTAFIINTARGPVVDEQALERALKHKQIAGAALDVLEFEPKPVRGLTKLPNVILTPHIASATTESRNQMAEIAAQNIIDFFEGKIPRNSITI